MAERGKVKMEIFLYRHGKTKGNLQKRYIGAKTDEPLCMEGLEAAHSQIHYPDVTKVYVSPMLRARQTAAILFPNANQVIVEGLQEMNFGSFEGKNYKDLEKDKAYALWVKNHCVGTCPEGEDMKEFIDRCSLAFLSIMETELCTEAQKVYIVAHGGTIMSIMSAFSKDPRAYFQWYIENLGCYKIMIERELWQKERKFFAEQTCQENTGCCG